MARTISFPRTLPPHCPTPHRRDDDVPVGRTLHLLDLENLAGDPRPGPSRALALVPTYLHLARWRPGDPVVVATNGWLLRQIAFDLPAGWQLRAANGPDGADRALLEVAPPDLVAARYHRLVVGSGDGIFSDLIARVGDRGVETGVVSIRRQLSNRLKACRSHGRVPARADMRASGGCLSRASRRVHP